MSPLREAQRYIANQTKLKELNAFISLADPAAILNAINGSVGDGVSRGPLHGRLIGVKDNICTTELPTTAASGILRSFKSPYDATVVKQLGAAGAIVAGKTNMDEFGMGSHSKHSYFGAVAQDGGSKGEKLSAGGSSGGSAVAVATDQCWAALGTDTGGSVRLPAAYTGVFGFKPSYGLLSRWGVIAYANSLDTVGILAKSTLNTRQIFECLNFHDPQDPTSLSKNTRLRIKEATPKGRTCSQLRIGVPTDYHIQELQPSIHRAWLQTLKFLSKQGHIIQPVSLPTTRHALSAYYVLAPAEASSNLAKYDGVRYGSRAPSPDGNPDEVLFSRTRGQGFGEEVKRRILLGAYSLSAKAMDNYFIQAQKVRRLVQRDFDQAFRLPNPLVDKESDQLQSADGVDVLICPTAPTAPPTLADIDDSSPVDAYMNDVFTVPASLAGLPAISVPVSVDDDNNNGTSQKVGIQVIAQFGDDDIVLDIAQMLEDSNSSSS